MKRNMLSEKTIKRISILVIALFILIEGDLPLSTTPLYIIALKYIRNVVFVYCYWESNRMIFIYLRNRFPKYEDTKRRIALHILIFIVYVLLAGLFFTSINIYMLKSSNNTFFHEYLEMVMISATLLGFITIVYECVYYFGLYEKGLYESEKLKKESLITQLEILKSQISPHFLFNSLNALITMVPENPQLSIVFIQKLSNVYRNVLSFKDYDLIDMETEKKFLDDFLFLHQMRFGEKLIINFSLSQPLQKYSVIPFTLQMLVENAIKHNIISQRKPLKIDIRMTKSFIQVENNLQLKTSGIESTNTGLQNIINRYKMLTNKVVSVSMSDSHFTVSIPLINKFESV